MASGTPKDKQNEASLPISRLRIIMKSSPSVENIGQDALQVMSKATELFINRLTSEAYNNSETTEVAYDHLCKCVENSEFEFLEDLFPEKMTVSECREHRRKEEAKQKEKFEKNGLSLNIPKTTKSSLNIPKTTKSQPLKPKNSPNKTNEGTPSKKKTVTPSKSNSSTPSKSSSSSPKNKSVSKSSKVNGTTTPKPVTPAKSPGGKK